MTDRRLTQEVVEAAVRLAAINNPRRLTQLVVEVAYVNPSQPFVETPQVQDPEWSPAESQADTSPAVSYASYFGVHRQEIVLGGRGTRVKIFRR